MEHCTEEGDLTTQILMHEDLNTIRPDLEINYS